MYVPTPEELTRLTTLFQAARPLDPCADDAALFELGLVDEDEGGDVSLTDVGRSIAAASPNEAAARLIVASMKNYTGRRLKVDRWRAIAAAPLKRKRLSQAKFEAVLRAGESLGIFRIDSDSGSYPFLVALDEPEPEPEPEPGPEPIADAATAVPVPPQAALSPPPPLPDDWHPPSHLQCGHMNWWTDDKHDVAREAGFCCAGGQNRRPTNPRFTPGPVPVRQRYSKKKAAMGGFPGLVCDEDGHYIGGIGNLVPR